MLNEINAVLELFIVFTSVFLVEKYVFLEPGLEAAVQRRFLVLSIILLTAFYILFGKDAAMLVVLFAGGLHISLGRTEHRLRGFFLVIPIPGIIDGLLVPILIMPPNVIGALQNRRAEYTFFVQVFIVFLLVLFYTKGKNWRKKFQAEMQGRHLRKWECFLLCMVGILMLFFSYNVLNTPIDDKTFTEAYVAQLPLNVCMIGLTSVVLTVIIIVLIMQGNLREEKERADAANKAKSAFISNISHEIRTPMNAIVGMTQIMLRRELPRQEREYLLNIQNSGNALLAIINDLLDMSKIESGRMELVIEEYGLMPMLSDLSMIILNRIGNKPVELLFDIDPDIPAKLCGDALRIRQIIINLMNNAVKFTEKGSVCLTIKVTQIQQDDIELFISVKDTGQGIREEDIGRLFGAFQQVDEKKNHHKEGTGLGLSISKQFVELMGGSIGVASEYGKGSEFYFTIHQKISDEERAAQLPDGTRAVAAGNMQNSAANEMLKELAGRYQLVYTEDIYAENINAKDMDVKDVDVKDVDANDIYAAGDRNAKDTGAAGETKLPVFYFTDKYAALSEEERQRLSDLGAVVCGMVNPMAENDFPEDIFTMNKPLYSYNFCSFIENQQNQNKMETTEGSLIKVNRESADADGLENRKDEEAEFSAQDACILVVDDNEINRMVAAEMLKPLGIQIETASDGKQAVEMVQKKKYDLVFMDHQMPVMDGITAVKTIRKLEGDYYKEVPVIALTADAAEEQQEEYRRAGMSDYISKPIDMEEMYGKIKKWIEQM